MQLMNTSARAIHHEEGVLPPQQVHDFKDKALAKKLKSMYPKELKTIEEMSVDFAKPTEAFTKSEEGFEDGDVTLVKTGEDTDDK